MKHAALLIALSGLLTLAPVTAIAGATPKAGAIDARIKTFIYNDNQVYALTGHYGFSTVIEFSPFETIDSVSMGDSESWQVSPSNKSNILFIKPVLQNAQTNMTVLTSQRIYSFELAAAKAESSQSGDLAFRVKFKYPDDEKEASAKEEEEEKYDPFKDRDSSDFNFRYSYAGSKRLKPLRAFDDGTFTYLRFRNFGAVPAVFAVDENGSEALVNFTMQDDYMVISSVSSQLTLRDGDIATCIFNELLQNENGIQRNPAPIDASPDRDMAIPIPEEKPYFAYQNKEGFFGRIGSSFRGSSYEQKQRGYNQ
jgi:type IV secretion system protein VirB9